jgi:hypothetical protein
MIPAPNNSPQTMTSLKASPSRISTKRAAAVLLGLAFVLGPIGIPAARAADATPAASDKVPSLPLTPAFAKVDGDNGPYVLNLKNISTDSIKVNAKILLSVAFHAESRARTITAHVIEAGQVWTITGLAADDKVTITADGFAPLQLTVP